ncbi:MAG: SDR family NAD(P)-dependent oxidoreductase [Acetivibrionales bacterium]
MKTIVVTGATSGIGLAVCHELAALEYGIIGVGRCEENCIKAAEQLSLKYPDLPIKFFCGNLLVQSEVIRVGNEIKDYIEEKCHGKLYSLINNAGCVRSYYMTTEDGYEQQFALNHLAGFLLTFILMPYLINSCGRILITSSASHKMMKMHWKDIMFKHRYNPLLVYKQSKLANMLFAYGLNDRFADCGISAYGIDPGLVRTDIGLKNTNGIVRLVWRLRQRSGVSPEVPAKTYSFICNGTKPPKGLYYRFSNEEPYSMQVNKQNADRLWALSEQLCGISFRKENFYGSIDYRRFRRTWQSLCY